MIIKIDITRNEAIHKQLEYAIKYGIITKQLKPNEQLPSIRSLANDLGINMHTVHKAYKSLELEKLISKNRYKFCITDLSEKVSSATEKEIIEEGLTAHVISAKLFGIQKEDVIRSLSNIYDSIEREVRNNE